MNNLKTFSKDDWYANGGAERGVDGTEPLIWANDKFKVLVDANGIKLRVYFCNEDGDPISMGVWIFNCPAFKASVAYAESLIDELVNDPSKFGPNELEELGFEFNMSEVFAF